MNRPDYDGSISNCLDQINGALFNGRQMVKPEELESEESQTVTLGKEEGIGNIKTIVDKVRIWKGKKLHILVVENQNYKDYRMVLRNMLSESIGYRKQWRQKKRIHKEAQDLKDGDEYLSGMKKEEKNREAYSRIDSDTRNMLEVVANIKIPEKCKVVEEAGKERYDMCKAFEDMKQESFEEGIEKGIRVLIQTCKELGISDQVIIEKCAEKYEMTKEAVGRYMKG